MRVKAAFLSIVLLVTMLPAQEPGAGQGQQPAQPAPQPQPGRTPTPGTQPQPGQQQQPRFPQDDMRDPFGRGRGVTGKIVPSPSTRMRVDLYIDGIRLDTSYTDMDGTFKFERQQAGRRYEIHLDLGRCVEYVEEVDFNFGYPVMIHIRNQGIRNTCPGQSEKPSGTMISVASLNVPKNASKEFEKGQKARQNGIKSKDKEDAQKKFDEALVHLTKAVELYPKYAAAYNEIGLIHRVNNRPDDAQKAFEHAINADPAWLISYLSLASLQMQANQPQQLLETSSKVLKLDPTLGPAHFFHSVANFTLGNYEAAEKSALEADKNEHGQVPQIHLVLARIYQGKGERSEASKHLKAYLRESPNAPNADKIKAEIESLKDAK